MRERHLEAVHARLLALSWPYVVRHLEDIQILSLTQPCLVDAILEMTTSAREASAASHVVLADAAEALQYWEDRNRRLSGALATVTRAKPAKVGASAHLLSLVPKHGLR